MDLAAAKRQLTDQRRRLGERHPETLETRLAVAQLTWARGEEMDRGPKRGCADLNSAHAQLLELLVDVRAVFGPTSAQALIVRRNLASLRWGMGDVDEALADLRGLLPELRRVLGAHHEETLEAALLVEEPFGVDAINDYVGHDLASGSAVLSHRTTLELCTASNSDHLLYLLLRDAVPADIVELLLSLPVDDWEQHQANVALAYRHLSPAQRRVLTGRGFAEELAMREDAQV